MASYCPACGVSLPLGARFCSTCGKPATAPPGVTGSTPSDWSRLSFRPRAGRKLAGVCQGLANQYGWDVTLIRVIAVVLAIMVFPVGLLAYGLLWLMMPEEKLVLPTATHLDPAS
jgi:phage shock protein C